MICLTRLVCQSDHAIPHEIKQLGRIAPIDQMWCDPPSDMIKN